jgi:hypothetical protein
MPSELSSHDLKLLQAVVLACTPCCIFFIAAKGILVWPFNDYIFSLLYFLERKRRLINCKEI